MKRLPVSYIGQSISTSTTNLCRLKPLMTCPSGMRKDSLSNEYPPACSPAREGGLNPY